VAEVNGEQKEQNEPTKEQADLLTSEQPGEQPGLLISEQFSGRSNLLTSEQNDRTQVLWTETDGLFTSEQMEEAADWLNSLLPKLSAGWWEVTPNGKGFVIKQRWRVSRKQETQPYPRMSREQFLTLKGIDHGKAEHILADRILGHLNDCFADRGKRDKARCAAARIGAAG
jgi:hypothetical protein